MRFEKKSDHYLDILSGLEWSLDTTAKMPPYAAYQQAEAAGWRIPTIYELIAIIRYGQSPATGLPGIEKDFYFSADRHIHYPDDVWGVNFLDGQVYPVAGIYPHYTRFVRCS